MAVLREVYDVVIEDRSHWVVRIALVLLLLLVLFILFHDRLGVVIR